MMGKTATRRVKPIVALLAGLFVLGLGYVYAGTWRKGLLTVIGVYGVVALFSWTRLLVQSATMFWIVAVLLFAMFVGTAIHAMLLAIKAGQMPRKQYNRWWVYLIWLAGVSAMSLTAFHQRAVVFGYDLFIVPSVSMSPTLETGDYFTTDTWRYRNHVPAVGEIVTMIRPETPAVQYVKRVVAVAGDRIEARDSVLYRNGQQVAESYVHPVESWPRYGRDFPVTLLAPGTVFVMGDFRDNSVDSRKWGPISVNDLRGRAQYIWLSVKDRQIRWARIRASLIPH